MADQRPCSCGGSNENCARCYGRGFIEGGPALAGRKDSIGILAFGRRRRKKGLSQSSSQSSASANPLSPRAANQRPMKNCPLCECQVREHKLQEHVDNKCPKRPGRTDRLKPRTLVVRVPHGIAEVIQQLNTDRLSKLGTRVAGPKQSVKKAQHSTGDAWPESVPHEDKVEVERWWDNLDATKNRGYPAREEGRYGSYPSHDGFDDESEP